MSAHDRDLGRFGHPNPELPQPAESAPEPSAGRLGGNPPPEPRKVQPLKTFAGVPVAAMEAAMLERVRQFELGHTVEADLQQESPRRIPDQAIRYLNMGVEDLQFHKGDWRTRAKRHFAQAAALAMAAWDYVDNGGGE